MIRTIKVRIDTSLPTIDDMLGKCFEDARVKGQSVVDFLFSVKEKAKYSDVVTDICAGAGDDVDVLICLLALAHQTGFKQGKDKGMTAALALLAGKL